MTPSKSGMLVPALGLAVALVVGLAAASPQTREFADRAARGDKGALDALVERVRKEKSADAEYELGLMAHEGRGLERNSRQALQLVQRAALKGHADACNLLGYFHQHGLGTPVDLPRALEWYRKGADAGSARAQANLGWFLEQGIAVAKDAAGAAEW